MNKESSKTPNLVNKSLKLPSIIKIDQKPKKWSLDVIVLIIFILFMAFFLLNCRSGLFKVDEPAPYSG